MSAPVVADGVLVYASDPTPTVGELVHDFVAGQIRLAMAGEGSGTNAAATEATSAGTAHAPQTTVSFPSGEAAGAGAADDATVTTAVVASAGEAASVGAAPAATATTSTVGTAGEASGAGAAETPTTALAVNPDAASGVGTAFNATGPTPLLEVLAVDANGVITYATDPAATEGELVFNFITGDVGLVLARDNSVFADASAGAAASVGTAHNTQTAVTVNAETATSTGVAETVGAGFEPAVATATGTAEAQASVAPSLFAATGTGTAEDLQAGVTVTAGVAESVGVAVQPSILAAVIDDTDPLTKSIRTRGSTVTLYRNYRS